MPRASTTVPGPRPASGHQGGGCGEVFGRSDTARPGSVSNTLTTTSPPVTNKGLRFPTESSGRYNDIQPRAKSGGGRSRLTSELTLDSPADTDNSFPRSLFPGQSGSNNIDQTRGQVTTPLTTSTSTTTTTTTTTTTEQPELDIDEIIERSRDFKCKKSKYVFCPEVTEYLLSRSDLAR